MKSERDQGERLDYLGLCRPETRVCHVEQELELESGERLTGFDIAYRTWGRPARTAVLVCHALTGSADVDDWWPGLLEAGGPIDPAEQFVLCSNVLAGCYGSSGPSQPSEADDLLLGLRFPQVSVRDMVRAQALWLDAISVERLSLVIGGSMGGMQVLEWAALYSDRVDRIVPVATSASHSAWCIGISHAQRRAIAADPDWADGVYAASERPVAGLEVARQIAMISYRSHPSFSQRFGRASSEQEQFDVESYLDHHGNSLQQRFDPASYYRITQAMDAHDLGLGRGGVEAALVAIEQPALVVGIDSDVLYPLVEQEEIARHLPNSRLEVISSPHGHDGFLIEQAALRAALERFLA